MADELKPAYLLAGSDRPKIDRALQRLRSRFAADAVELHSAAETTGEDVVAAANALGLFAGDGRLIVVDGVEAWKAQDAKAIADVPQGARARDDARARRGRAEEGRAARRRPSRPTGEVLIWDVAEERASRPGSREQFKLHGAKAEPEACRALIELVGDDLYELATEIDKLATWAAGERDHRAQTSRRSSRRGPRRSNFALTDAWGARDVAGVLRRRRAAARAHGRPALAHDPARRRHPHEPRRAAPRVPGARGRRPVGEGRRRAAQAHPFYVQKLYAQARNFTRRRAPRRDRAPRRARPRAQGRVAPDRRARARARADRDRAAHAAATDEGSAPATARLTDRPNGRREYTASHVRSRGAVARSRPRRSTCGVLRRRAGRRPVASARASVACSRRSYERRADGCRSPIGGSGRRSVARAPQLDADRATRDAADRARGYASSS